MLKIVQVACDRQLTSPADLIPRQLLQHRVLDRLGVRGSQSHQLTQQMPDSFQTQVLLVLNGIPSVNMAVEASCKQQSKTQR